jgi:hypothetical protein
MARRTNRTGNNVSFRGDHSPTSIADKIGTSEWDAKGAPWNKVTAPADRFAPSKGMRDRIYR